MKNAADRPISHLPPIPAIRLDAGEGRDGIGNREILLAIFMRIVALLWIVQGLVQWGALLMDPTGDIMLSLSTQRLAALFFFCVLDFVAAVGLWLATPWGGVVWLITVGAQVLSLILLPGFWQHAKILAVSDVALIVIYLALAWYATHGNSKKI